MENKAKEKAIELVEKFGDKASDFCDEVIKSFEILNRNLDNVYQDIRTPASAMSSGGFGTAQYQNTTNDNRKHER